MEPCKLYHMEAGIYSTLIWAHTPDEAVTFWLMNHMDAWRRYPGATKDSRLDYDGPAAQGFALTCLHNVWDLSELSAPKSPQVCELKQPCIQRIHAIRMAKAALGVK